MDKKILNMITLVAFILLGINATFANTDTDGFEVQSLNVDNTLEEKNSTAINMTNKKFPIKEEEEKKEENNIIVPTQNYYQPYPPYGYNTNYVQYKKIIGPYYTTGINRGYGYNYKGFGYNYTGHGYNYGYSVQNNNPIYITPPPPPPHMPPPMHRTPCGHNHHMPNYKP